MTTLDDLLVHHARVRPSATAFCDGVVARTFAELERDVSRAASGLRRLGVDARTHIALRLGDCVEWISVFLGAARLGARVHLLDVTASESVWARALRRAECRVLITDAWELAAARRIVAASWAPCTIVARGLRASEPDVVSLDALYQASAARDAHPSADHPVVHLYTSGSTGDARSVARTHAQFMAETGQVMRGLGVEPSDGIVCLPPFHHSFGLEMGVLLALRAGAPLLALPGGDGSAAPGPFPARLGALSAVIQTSVARVLLGVPYHFEALGDSDFDLSTLRWCISSAGFLASSTVDAFLTKHGRLIRSSYGSTEVGTVTLGADGLRHANTVGTPLPTVEVKILDDDDRTCAPGQTGRVVVRTAVLARGYDDPDPQQRRFLDGAFDMGDRGHIDPAGRLVLDGRSSRFLDVAGHKVDPCGVERVLESSRDVREAAVVAEGGRPGGAVVAFVVSDTLDVAGLRALCAEHLRPFEVPQRFVRLDALPRTSASKLRRRLLEEKAEESAASARSTAAGTSESAASLELLQSAVVEVLELQQAGGWRDHPRPLHEAGLDSLDLVELRRALEAPLASGCRSARSLAPPRWWSRRAAHRDERRAGPRATPRRRALRRAAGDRQPRVPLSGRHLHARRAVGRAQR
ncbi:MAG: class I adenylate-forming enzyme family protein [Nannocystaceae bacterium]